MGKVLTTKFSIVKCLCYTVHIILMQGHIIKNEYKNLTKWLENVLLSISCNKIGHTQKSNVNTQSFTLKHIDHICMAMYSHSHTHTYTHDCSTMNIGIL